MPPIMYKIEPLILNVVFNRSYATPDSSPCLSVASHPALLPSSLSLIPCLPPSLLLFLLFSSLPPQCTLIIEVHWLFWAHAVHCGHLSVIKELLFLPGMLFPNPTWFSLLTVLLLETLFKFTFIEHVSLLGSVCSVLEARNPRSRCPQVWFGFRPSPWLAVTWVLAVSSYGLSSVCTPPPPVFLCVS